MFVQILQLRPGEEIPPGPLQGLPGRDTPRLRIWPTVRTGEVLGIHEILQVLFIFIILAATLIIIIS